MLQYVTSPVWRQHVENFKDEFSQVFDKPS